MLFAASAIVLLAGGSLLALAWTFVAARVVALVAAFAIARAHVGELRPSFDFTIWKELQRRAVPLGAFLIVLNLYSYIDTVMLGILSTDVETGLYNAAYRSTRGSPTRRRFSPRS